MNKTSKLLLTALGCVIAAFVMCGLIVSIAEKEHIAQAAPPDTVHLSGVYLLTGYNIHSYTFNMKGEAEWTGVAHDFAAIINPVVKNDEFVQHIMDDGCVVYFYRDTVVKTKSPVYRLKPNAICYVEDEKSLNTTAETEKWWKEVGFLFNMEIGSNGGNRVYITPESTMVAPDKLAMPNDTKDGKYRFFYRSDMVLVNPQDVD